MREPEALFVLVEALSNISVLVGLLALAVAAFALGAWVVWKVFQR